MASLYKRPLPAEHVAFSSDEGRALFRQALDAGTLEPYFRLSEQHHTQADPAFCGLGALVVALNALSIDPGRHWKGPWRWFSEELLDCCFSLDRVKDHGLTLGQVACLASCNGAHTEVVLAQNSTEDAFRDALRRYAGQAFGAVMITNYDRSALGQTGTGHFSPLAGYDAVTDRVLVLDVARFKYPSHWVGVGELYRAMLSVDPQATTSRGWLTLKQANTDWRLALAFETTGLNSPLLPFVGDELRKAFAQKQPGTVDAVLALSIAQLAPIAENIQPRRHEDDEARALVDSVLCQLRNTALFEQVTQSSDAASPEVLTGLMLCLPSSVFRDLDPELVSAIERLRATAPSALQDEVCALRDRARLFEPAVSVS